MTKMVYTSFTSARDGEVRLVFISPNGQEYCFLQVSEIFLSLPAISAWALKVVSICQSLLNIAQPYSFQPLNLLLAM